MKSKFLVIELDKLDTSLVRPKVKLNKALELLRENGMLNEQCAVRDDNDPTHGVPDPSADEFFVIKLKDQFAAGALYGYLKSLNEHVASLDPDTQAEEITRLSELGEAVAAMMNKSKNYPNRRIPT